MTTHTVERNERGGKAVKPYKGMGMEGVIAKWYAKIREEDEALATTIRQVQATVAAGSRILEVAPGPGYLAIELAKLGSYQVVGVDISRSFVQMAQEKAKEAGVAVDFRLGNAADMPFEGNSFDFTICRAAFKNFSEPVEAIREMYRVLKPGGKALIADLRRDASLEEINRHVGSMGLNWVNRAMTKATFKYMLLKNAYTPAEIRQMVAQTDFGKCEIREDAVGMEIWLEKM